MYKKTDSENGWSNYALDEGVAAGDRSRNVVGILPSSFRMKDGRIRIDGYCMLSNRKAYEEELGWLKRLLRSSVPARDAAAVEAIIEYYGRLLQTTAGIRNVRGLAMRMRIAAVFQNKKDRPYLKCVLKDGRSYYIPAYRMNEKKILDMLDLEKTAKLNRFKESFMTRDAITQVRKKIPTEELFNIPLPPSFVNYIVGTKEQLSAMETFIRDTDASKAGAFKDRVTKVVQPERFKTINKNVKERELVRVPPHERNQRQR